MDLPHCLSGLRPIRKARRFKVKEMAAVIAVEPTSYSRIETGDRRCYFDKVVSLAKKLQVRTDDLIDYLDEQSALRLCCQRDNELRASGGLVGEAHMFSYSTSLDSLQSPPDQLAVPNSAASGSIAPPPPNAAPPPPDNPVVAVRRKLTLEERNAAIEAEMRDFLNSDGLDDPDAYNRAVPPPPPEDGTPTMSYEEAEAEAEGGIIE